MITIILNGQPHHLNDRMTIADLVVGLELQGKRIAVEVNRELVSRSVHATHYLQANDQVEIVHAIGGG